MPEPIIEPGNEHGRVEQARTPERTSALVAARVVAVVKPSIKGLYLAGCSRARRAIPQRFDSRFQTAHGILRPRRLFCLCIPCAGRFSSASSLPCSAGRRRRLKASPLRVDRLPNAQSGSAINPQFEALPPRTFPQNHLIVRAFINGKLALLEWMQEPR